MNKHFCFLFLFFLIFVFSAKAQQDTTSEKGWTSMPVVSDSQIVSNAPKIDSQTYKQYIKDSLKAAAAKEDSLKIEVDEKEFIKENIKALCSKGMYGRGYVKEGWDNAAKYILKKFKEFKLKPVIDGGPYAQGFAFPVNTFPGKMDLFINGDSLFPGADFLIDASSPSFVTDSFVKLKVKKINLDKISDTAAWMAKITKMDSSHAYYLTNIESMCERLDMRKDQLLAQLPKGCFIIPEENKLTWTVHREPIAATVFYVKEDSLPRKVKNVSVNVNAVYTPHQRSENIIACVRGTVKDTFIVFSAHYDHLGMMGNKTVFSGASDNASGTAMLLYLASYFSKHPQHYSILFIAFGAEEVSLMGSEFYVWHPFVPLKNIKFLTNIDIMGDASNGITVVNATENIPQFTLLQQINDKNKYIRTVYPRENAANSDHYYFTKMHVPCFFIYSNGGNGYYHDIHDVRTALSLNHVEGVARLLIDFVNELKDVPATMATNTVAPNTTSPTEITIPPKDGTVPPKEEEPSSKPEEKPEK
ncbi:MAG: M28 family metallopeptidase [Sphingobacteriales bacterium]